MLITPQELLTLDCMALEPTDCIERKLADP